MKDVNNLVMTNRIRLISAAEACHQAISALDKEQFELFASNQTGQAMMFIANQFANETPGIKHFYTDMYN